jgi:hypothetical protein
MHLSNNVAAFKKKISGILPTHQDASDFVHKQRQEQYTTLSETLAVMKRITAETPVPHVHIRMYLVEQGRLPLKENNMVILRFHLLLRVGCYV